MLDQRDPLLRSMDEAQKNRLLTKIARLRGTLIAAKRKLEIFRAERSGEYTGGMEYRMLMNQIEEVLDETS